MKPQHLLSFCAGVLLTRTIAGIGPAGGVKEGYIVEYEKEIAREEPGPHDGGGKTVAHSFFQKLTDLSLTVRKRILYPGSSIGYRLQQTDEIYYFSQGKGIMTMNGKTFTVSAGDAILTRPGNRMGLRRPAPTALRLSSITINKTGHAT